MVKKILKLVNAFTPKKTYELLPEIWNLIKEYAVPHYVEPIKIGERFIYYETEYEEGIRYLREVSLCVRVEDRVNSLESQKKWKSPILKMAQCVALQTLKPHPRNHSKLVLSRLKDEDYRYTPHTLFWIRRSVAGVPNCEKYLRRDEVMYWETDKPYKDELEVPLSYMVDRVVPLSVCSPFVKTCDPKLSRQFIKTNLKKLPRSICTITPTGVQFNL